MSDEPKAKAAIGFVRTAIVVTLVSVLIWIVAEGESLAHERIEVTVRLVDDPGGTIMIQPLRRSNWNGLVTIELEGSTAQVANLRELLRDPIQLKPGDPGISPEPGQHIIDFAQTLRQSPLFVGKGVSILSVEPERIAVQVDQVQWHDFDVRVDVPDLASASSPVAQPKQVRVLVPSQLAGAVADVTSLTARLSPMQIQGLEVGQRNTISDVPVELPAALRGHPFVRMEPATVSVIVTIESREDSIKLETVPVLIRRPAFQSQNWVVTIDPADQLLQGVTVTGPDDLIERIRSGDLKVFATVTLTPDDLDARISEKQASFTDFPTPLHFSAPSTTVRLSITPAPQPESP